ncbi:hypothetical protein B0T17DRAFT_523403 [Bombardia bombarda]|uniref:NACHT domain-containing protein n=1 Tax=Bombardia bombarda TaxID=252184 RepID=A0AA40C8A3_9PEZI|nr:hypothetical protein B0T17DRAFT_523403 [Bombardia bombarda]
MRQQHMKELVQRGQEKISKASRITTGVGDVADFILSAKAMVDTVIQSVPQAAPAALPWAGVCIGLQILRNPAQATRSNLAGIAHVISRMDWYCALSQHLLSRNNIAANNDFQAVLRQLEVGVVELYKALLLYQMKSVCSYYRNQGLVFLRGMLSLDDWDGDLGLATDAEAVVQKDAAQYAQELTKASLAVLADDAKKMEKRLGDIHQDIQDLISLQKDIRRDDIESACRRDLCVVDPQHDMKRIEETKDELLDDAFKWILRTPNFAAFTNWDDTRSDCQARRLLWIKGHAGTGKTMLMIGLIRQLSRQPVALAPGLSFFFCQGTDTTLNNATAVLRSLIWLLLYQQPCLVSHLLQKYKDSGTKLFTDKNAFIALSEAFRNMLEDTQLSPVYLAVDALDECAQGRSDLLRLIATSLSLSPKIKWLLSSRPEVDLLAELRTSGTGPPDISEGLLELGTQRLTEPVSAYIRHKLASLRNRPGYDEIVLAEISDEVHERAENTFLWVALAFKALGEVHGAYAAQYIKEMPSGLTDLYDHMMMRIEKGRMIPPQDCKRALVAISLAFRPLSPSELSILAELRPNATKAAVETCGSFLTITGETVTLIHQSAKDYLEKNFTFKLQPAGAAQSHADISEHSIDAMSSLLRQNVYNLDFAVIPDDITPPNPDPLASIRYSCEFWADHLCFMNGESPEFSRGLTENGKVLMFLREHLLHWLEVLSLLGKLSDGVASIRKLLAAQVCQFRLGAMNVQFLINSN